MQQGGRRRLRSELDWLWALEFSVDGCARDVEEFCQFGLGVRAGSVDGEQVAAFGGREFGLFQRSLPLALATAMPSRVLIRIRSASNSATMPRTLNSSRPTGSSGS